MTNLWKTPILDALQPLRANQQGWRHLREGNFGNPNLRSCTANLAPLLSLLTQEIQT